MTYTYWDYSQPFGQYQPIIPDYGQPDYGQPEPIDNAEDCVLVQGESRRWIVGNCSVLNYFICELV